MIDTIAYLAAIHEADLEAVRAVGRVLPEVARAVDAIAARLDAGGKWINVGAGTSGRLGVLDASELPPTFGVAPRLVTGLIAGGDEALVSAVEGAEDDEAQGAEDVKLAGVTLAGRRPRHRRERRDALRGRRSPVGKGDRRPDGRPRLRAPLAPRLDRRPGPRRRDRAPRSSAAPPG